MKFNIPFSAEIKIIKVYSQSMVKARIISSELKSDSPSCIVYGTFTSAYEGDIFRISAEYQEHEKYGFVIKSLSIPECVIPSEKEGFSKWAASQIKGVSKKTVERIYDIYGASTLKAVAMDEHSLDGINIREEQKSAFRKWCEGKTVFFVFSGELRAMGFSSNEIFEIDKRNGSSSLLTAKTDPYTFYYQDIISFRKADSVFKKTHHNENDEKRQDAILFYELKNRELDGDMAAEVQSFSSFISRHYPFIDMEKTVERCTERGLFGIFRLNEAQYYAFNENWMDEKIIADYLSMPSETAGMDWNRIREICSPKLLEQQKEAICVSLSNRISLITGGPGTGKTFTIKNMIDVAKTIDPKIKISLMAPTGKAASRMIELSGQEATTVHAAFGISENDDLTRSEGMILDDDMIIVDEVSMMGEKLFAYFIRHISPSCRVVLVGDPGQLPSVDPGNLLQQLMKTVPYTMLKITKRSGVAVLNRNAERIRNRDISRLVYDDSYFEFQETDNIVQDAVRAYQDMLFFTHERPMLLAPQYSGPGVDAINSVIQEASCEEGRQFREQYFKIHDRVMRTKNTKKLNIHNGDQGEITGFTEKGIMVLFDGKDEEIEIKDTAELKLAYCITTHKSQGSEADTVIMVFSPAHENMLSNRLIYTGITRAKKHFIGIGNRKSFENGCLRADTERVSLIYDMILSE